MRNATGHLRDTGRRGAGRTAALTLIELLVVIAIISAAKKTIIWPGFDFPISLL